MASYPLSLSIIKLTSDFSEANATMRAKWETHVAAKALIAQFRALKPKAICIKCGGVGMKVSIVLATPIPCGACRPEAFAEHFAALAYEYEVLRPLMAEEGGYGEELCEKPEVKTWVATDLTLRCCACGSNVDKRDGVVHCFTCAKGKKL